MWAMSCVERYRTVFSFEARSCSKIDRMCEFKRVLAVSGKDSISFMSDSGTNAMSIIH
jgi:hypothetical protein